MCSTRDVIVQVLLPLLIFTFGPVSGAHFNPMVTATFMATRAMVWADSSVHSFFQYMQIRTSTSLVLGMVEVPALCETETYAFNLGWLRRC